MPISYTGSGTQVAILNSGTTDASGFGGTPSAGQGAPGILKSVHSTRTVAAADVTTTSTVYNMARLRSTAILKRIRLVADRTTDTSSAAATRWAIGAAYSNGPLQSPPILDGTPVANAGNQVTNSVDTTGTSSLGTAISFANSAATLDVNVTATNGMISGVASGVAGASALNMPLWQALGLASDPGGFFDLTLKVATAATSGSSQSSVIAMEVQYV